MNPRELLSRTESPNPPILLNVLPPEVFQEKRIPGSVNACVYEMTFLENVTRLIPSKDQPIIVHGAGPDSLEGAVAAEKLKRAGYSSVEHFDAGLDGWVTAGFPTVGTPRPVEEPKSSETFHVDPESSIIRWTGRNLFNHHSGTLRLSGGEITTSGGNLAAATFTIDMCSIACEDIPDPRLNAMLVAHLKSDDFFDVENHPAAFCSLERAQRLTPAIDGRPNVALSGSLTLRGVTRQVSFPAVVAVSEDGNLTGQAFTEIDRTEFQILYGSGKFFSHLGKHLVNDHIQLHLKINARP